MIALGVGNIWTKNAVVFFVRTCARNHVASTCARVLFVACLNSTVLVRAEPTAQGIDLNTIHAALESYETSFSSYRLKYRTVTREDPDAKKRFLRFVGATISPEEEANAKTTYDAWHEVIRDGDKIWQKHQDPRGDYKVTIYDGKNTYELFQPKSGEVSGSAIAKGPRMLMAEANSPVYFSGLQGDEWNIGRHTNLAPGKAVLKGKTKTDGKAVYHISTEPSRPGGTKVELYLDPSHDFLALRMETIGEDDKPIYIHRVNRFGQFHDHSLKRMRWFPVEATFDFYMSEIGGFLSSTVVTVVEVEINPSVSPEVFKPSIADGIPVVDHESHETKIKGGPKTRAEIADKAAAAAKQSLEAALADAANRPKVSVPPSLPTLHLAAVITGCVSALFVIVALYLWRRA